MYCHYIFNYDLLFLQSFFLDHASSVQQGFITNWHLLFIGEGKTQTNQLRDSSVHCFCCVFFLSPCESSTFLQVSPLHVYSPVTFHSISNLKRIYDWTLTKIRSLILYNSDFMHINIS